jgi:mono/diheme cytochrome c family protein
MTGWLTVSIDRARRRYRELFAMTRTRETLKLLLRPLRLASTLLVFSACAFAEDTDVGKMNYQSNCAACHGQNGKGDGPVSVELRTKPTDLTLIAKRNGGVFPADVLYRLIDGRKTSRAHGTYEMPAWGLVFLRSDPGDVARNRILAIITYLKSIQVE